MDTGVRGEPPLDEVARQRLRHALGRPAEPRAAEGGDGAVPLLGLLAAVRRRRHHAWRIETIGRLQLLLLPD